MAIFGFHIVLTMITATFAHRLLPRFAPCSQWFAVFLYRYAMPAKPSEEDSKAMGNYRQKIRKRSGNVAANKEPASSDSDVLYRLPLTLTDLSNIAFTTDIEIVFDFAMASVIVLSTADIRAFFYPCEAASETNLSLVWCWIALALSIRALFVTLRIFMRESSFTSVCLMSGCVFALLSMVILSFPDNFVDLKLMASHECIETALASAFNRTAEITETAGGSLNFNLFRGFLALLAGVFGTLLTFPGLRFVKLYSATIQKEFQNTGSWKDAVYFYVLRGLLHMALVTPLILTLLWMKPVTNALFDMNEPGIEDKLNSIRTGVMLFMSIIQLAVCIPLLQTHLDSAEKRVSYSLSKQNAVNLGRPAEKPVDLRREVLIPAQSFGIVSVQVLTPALMMLMLALLLKALLGASWLPPDFRHQCTVNQTANLTNSQQPSGNELLGQLLSKVTSDDSLTNFATDLATSVSRFRVAAGTSPALWYSTVGFAVFWMCIVQLLTSVFGLWHARGSLGDPEQTLF